MAYELLPYIDRLHVAVVLLYMDNRRWHVKATSGGATTKGGVVVGARLFRQCLRRCRIYERIDIVVVCVSAFAVIFASVWYHFCVPDGNRVVFSNFADVCASLC